MQRAVTSLTANAPELISEAEVTSLSGRRARIRARHFVLAAGAIENARLLLANGLPRGNRAAQAGDNVGRRATARS